MILHNLRFRIVEENYVEKKRKILLRVENFPSSILCDALQNVYALAEHTETTRITAHCIIPNPRLQREHEARISARTTYSSDVTSPLPLSLSRPPPLRRPTCITATLHACNFSCAWRVQRVVRRTSLTSTHCTRNYVFDERASGIKWRVGKEADTKNTAATAVRNESRGSLCLSTSRFPGFFSFFFFFSLHFGFRVQRGEFKSLFFLLGAYVVFVYLSARISFFLSFFSFLENSK